MDGMVRALSAPADIPCASVPLPAPHHRVLKRIVDLTIAIPCLVMLLPVILVFAGLVYFVNPGPVFFAQERVGYKGRRVRVWKIRSMYIDAEARLAKLLATDPLIAAEWQRRFKLRNDPRVLPAIGRFIRRHSIDELPQLWNVVKGELSLVGPRIFADYDLALYSPEQLVARQSLMPGLTGLWQVSARNDGDNRDKIRYDMAYARTWSIWLDLVILYRTLGIVLTGRGAC